MINKTIEERHKTAIEVYEAALIGTESFEVDNIGADLAYLMAAILKGSTVGWGRYDKPALWTVLVNELGRKHDVFTYNIVLEDE